MKFVTYKKLNHDILNNIHKIPRDIDIVVGVPRSGVVVASIIALYLNKPLVDLDSFLDGRMSSVGVTKNTSKFIKSIDEAQKVLIVEDTVDSGRSISMTRKRLDEVKKNVEYIFFAGYVKSASSSSVDIFLECIDEDRVFEWNYMHSVLLDKACVDIDGVLCQDPLDQENDDGEKYIKFLLNANPKLIPSRKIGYIVTSRLEKYRGETEQWLKKQGIEYNHLIMMNVATAKDRQQMGNHAEFKASQFKKLKDASWFIESNDMQAQEISLRSKKMVFSVETQTCYDEGKIRKLKNKVKIDYFRPLKRKIRKILGRMR